MNDIDIFSTIELRTGGWLFKENDNGIGSIKVEPQDIFSHFFSYIKFSNNCLINDVILMFENYPSLLSIHPSLQTILYDDEYYEELCEKLIINNIDEIALEKHVTDQPDAFYDLYHLYGINKKDPYFRYALNYNNIRQFKDFKINFGSFFLIYVSDDEQSSDISITELENGTFSDFLYAVVSEFGITGTNKDKLDFVNEFIKEGEENSKKRVDNVVSLKGYKR
jgi:hypothetical protein